MTPPWIPLRPGSLTWTSGTAPHTTLTSFSISGSFNLPLYTVTMPQEIPATESPFTAPVRGYKIGYLADVPRTPFRGYSWACHPAAGYGQNATAVCNHDAFNVGSYPYAPYGQAPPPHDDAVPHPNCTCGFYLSRECADYPGNLAFLPSMATGMGHTWQFENDMWGRCVEHPFGFRFARQRVRVVRPPVYCASCFRSGPEKMHGWMPVRAVSATTPSPYLTLPRHGQATDGAAPTPFIVPICAECAGELADGVWGVRPVTPVTVSYIRSLIAPAELDTRNADPMPDSDITKLAVRMYPRLAS